MDVCGLDEEIYEVEVDEEVLTQAFIWFVSVGCEQFLYLVFCVHYFALFLVDKCNFFREFAICMAVFIAEIMLVGLARFFCAISKAVPWAGEVRIMGRPMVMLTAFSKARSLTGIIAWSWYIAMTPSNSPLDARRKTVSAGYGP